MEQSVGETAFVEQSVAETAFVEQSVEDKGPPCAVCSVGSYSVAACAADGGVLR